MKHHLPAVTYLTHHGVKAALERSVVVTLSVPEAVWISNTQPDVRTHGQPQSQASNLQQLKLTPHPRAEDQTEPALRLEVLRHHQRDHVELLLMSVIRLQTAVGALLVRKRDSVEHDVRALDGVTAHVIHHPVSHTHKRTRR